VVTQASSGTSTLGGTPGFQLTYTDPDAGTITTPQGAPANGSNTAYSQTNQNNNSAPGGTQAGGVLVVNVSGTSNIQYSFGYASSPNPSMQYALHITVEAL